jgi:hypothetical protein
MALQWYYSKGGGQSIGPVTAAELQSMAKTGQLLPNDMIWKEGMANWAPASNLKGLFAEQAIVVQPPPLPPSITAPSDSPPDARRRSGEPFKLQDRGRSARRSSRSRYDDYEDDEEDYLPRRRPRRQGETGAGKVCSILSVIFGGVAFVLCPPIFGLAGLILGIVGTSLSKDKSLGILGMCLSVAGTIVGMIIGMALMNHFPHF